MKLYLTENGNPQSCFLKACAEHRISFAASNDSASPLQLVPARWRTLEPNLVAFVEELAWAEKSFTPIGDPVLKIFRQVVYDATEVFDSYAQLIPSRLRAHEKTDKKLINDFKKTANRLRSPCAALCNRCKHQGAQLKFLWARSPSNGVTGSRFLVSSYSDLGLLRDDTIHKGKLAGIGLVRWAHELGHNLLRIDRAAGMLISKLTEFERSPTPIVPPELPVGSPLKALSAIRATRHRDEASSHNGLIFSQSHVSLDRVQAVDFGPRAEIVTSFTVETGTTNYSIA